MRPKVTMAISNASLVWALLFVACLMNSGRSFVVHHPARMRASTSATRSRRGVATLAKRASNPRSATGGGRYTRWHHGSVGMEITAAAAGGGEISKSICSQTKFDHGHVLTCPSAGCWSRFTLGAATRTTHVRPSASPGGAGSGF